MQMKQKRSICLFQRHLQSPVFTKDTGIRDLVFAFQHFLDCSERRRDKQMIVIQCTTCSKGVNRSSTETAWSWEGQEMGLW